MSGVLERLCSDSDWLTPLAHRAADDGEGILVRLRPRSASRFGVRAVVRLGEPHQARDDYSVVIPIRWEAATLSGLFPVLDGQIELTPMGAESCRINMNATYRPPLDGVGKYLDRALLHHLAESTVRSFLHQIADGLTG
jgi:hypothetical protein